MTSDTDGRDQRQLRLALGMRGGASMAVWIGGAVAEIDHLREAMADPETGQPDPSPWARLARLAGYESVDVDVLAGASAGGLNATLLSASLVYGMPFDSMRQTWVRLADLEAMARPVPKFWNRRPRSLLEGDAYFRPELARTLLDRIPPSEQARSGRLDTLLTATLLEPVARHDLDGNAEPILTQRRRASFRFRHRGRPGHPLSDFGDTERLTTTVEQLAQAARTTSSFPVAFEPGEIHSARGDPPRGVPNMYGLFSETAASTDSPTYRVFDGGVLDNIPVTAAIRSITGSMADRPVDRWLLYLNPDPATDDAGRRHRRWFALPVALAALRARSGQESLLSDLEALHRHNDSVQRGEMRRRALYAGLNSASPRERAGELARRVEVVRDEHALVRAELDARTVRDILTDPNKQEESPLLEPVAGDPLEGWPSRVRDELGTRLSERFAHRAGTDPRTVLDGVRSLLSGVDECLGWARDVEHRTAHPREVGNCKAALYRLRTVGELLHGHGDRYWITGARLEPITQFAELDDWTDRVLERRLRLWHHLPAPVGPLLAAVLAAVEEEDGLPGQWFQQALTDLAAELSSIVDSSGADAAASNDDHVDAVAEATAVLNRIAVRLAAVAPERDTITEPHEVGYSLLEQEPAEQLTAVLRRLVILTVPLEVDGVRGSRIKFLRVTSDADTPLPFDALLTRGHVNTADKVRGSTLGGFAAFLSAKWRANDWMWGRMDSASTLVDLLLDPERLVRYNAELGAEGLGDAIQAVVSRPTPAEGRNGEQTRRWREFLAERWADRAGEVRAELDALFERPGGRHPLTETRKVVLERLQWTIAAAEVPFVTEVSSGAAPDASPTPVAAEPNRLATDVRSYDVGRQRVDDLGERRRASTATRFALIAYRAVVPGRRGVAASLARCAMTVLKPVVMAVVFAFAAPLRAAAVSFAAATGVALTADSVPATRSVLLDLAGSSFGHGAYVAAALAVLAAPWLGWQLAGRTSRGPARWGVALVAAAVLIVLGYWPLSTGIRIGPVVLAALAVALTWFATLAYRPGGRIAATGLTAIVLVASLWGLMAGVFSVGGWVLVSFAASAYAHMLLQSTVDVLRPRPRSERSATEGS
ncbi:patatin-related protein [Saccharopolyspora lacisalsi]|uniref:Patatin-related protein n=1 Tax=Halosaccharopolyspora lacisalsi TaxID=1000566 RepID=A0A839DUK3_9PSEU|nr:patatin-like protein [Halosaccharopolyspora lacisalsi]MBA8822955.1 patatin-related protein [Halosaccharopolyspora lacisalsi]